MKTANQTGPNRNRQRCGFFSASPDVITAKASLPEKARETPVPSASGWFCCASPTALRRRGGSTTSASTIPATRRQRRLPEFLLRKTAHLISNSMDQRAATEGHASGRSPGRSREPGGVRTMAPPARAPLSRETP